MLSKKIKTIATFRVFATSNERITRANDEYEIRNNRFDARAGNPGVCAKHRNNRLSADRDAL